MLRYYSTFRYICTISLTIIVLVTGYLPSGQAAVSTGNITLTDSLTDTELGSASGQVTDVWGYQDPSTSKEYALVCFKKQANDSTTGGTAIVDVSNPTNIFLVLNNMDSKRALDVKTYIQSGTGDVYAYVANGIDDDVKIFDISDPANPIPVGAIPVDTVGSGATVHQVHNMYIDGDNNSLKYCVFEDGDWGVKFIGSPNQASGNVVEYCTFRNNDQGLRIERNEVVVKNNVIRDNRHGIVTINNTEVEFHGNHVYNNDRDGIYSISNNYLQLYGNVIENNGLGSYSSRNGIYTWNGDNIELGDLNGQVWGGYNTIRDNYATEVYAGYGDPLVEILVASIYDNAGDEVYNYSGNPTIAAYSSWWGESPPDGSQFTGDVAVYTPQTSAPSWNGTTQSTGWLPKTGTTEHPAPPTPALIARLKQMVQDHIGTVQADSALVRLNFYVRRDYKANTLGERDQYGGFLTQLYTGRPHTLEGQRALRYLIAWKTLHNEVPEAIDLSQIALTNNSDYYRLGILENLVLLHMYAGDLGAAEQVLATLQSTYPQETTSIQFLTETLAEAQAGARETNGLAKPGTRQSGEASILPESVVLHQNYPNPFNPSTTIGFGLPTAQNVQLVIYDVRGHQVATVVEQQMPKGYHAVRWDARNATGVRTASGLYIYQLRTSHSVISKKLMLLR